MMNREALRARTSTFVLVGIMANIALYLPSCAGVRSETIENHKIVKEERQPLAEVRTLSLEWRLNEATNNLAGNGFTVTAWSLIGIPVLVTQEITRTIITRRSLYLREPLTDTSTLVGDEVFLGCLTLGCVPIIDGLRARDSEETVPGEPNSFTDTSGIQAHRVEGVAIDGWREGKDSSFVSLGETGAKGELHITFDKYGKFLAGTVPGRPVNVRGSFGDLVTATLIDTSGLREEVARYRVMEAGIPLPTVMKWEVADIWTPEGIRECDARKLTPDIISSSEASGGSEKIAKDIIECESLGGECGKREVARCDAVAKGIADARRRKAQQEAKEKAEQEEYEAHIRPCKGRIENYISLMGANPYDTVGKCYNIILSSAIQIIDRSHGLYKLDGSTTLLW